MIVRTETDSVARRKAKPSKGRAHSSAADSVEKTDLFGFKEILNEVLPSSELGESDLHLLWEELPGAERGLISHPSEDNFKRYRELVQRFSAEPLRKNPRLVKIPRRSRLGETLELTVVQFIDERLQRMAEMLHNKRNNAFNILKSVDEIRGMLLDLRE